MLARRVWAALVFCALALCPVNSTPAGSRLQQDEIPQRYCGSHLGQALNVVCKGRYLSWWDIYGSTERGSIDPLKNSDGSLRLKMGIDCCSDVCSIEQLRTYCGKRRT